MKSRIFVLIFVASTLTMFHLSDLLAQDTRSDKGQPEPPMAGVHWAKGQQPQSGGSTSSPNLLYHGGPIMPATQVTAIFWGTSWKNYTGDKITGIDTFYQGMGGSSYAVTSDEYTDPTDGPVTPAIGYIGHFVDSSSASAAGNGNRTSPILTEVCKIIGNAVVSNGYYPVYVDTPRGHAGFCAWHSAGTCGSTPVQFAFFFNLDGDPGCDPQSAVANQSQGLAALANVSGHEISEMRSDPRLNAWFDSSGSENADKCAWSFGSPSVTFSPVNGVSTSWKIQGNWSNSAYLSTNRGYANLSGQKGCIDGGNFN
jgi:hypothetical protein